MIKKYAMLSLFHYGNIFHNLDDAYGKKMGMRASQIQLSKQTPDSDVTSVFDRSTPFGKESKFGGGLHPQRQL